MQASLGSAPCANSNAGDSTSDGSSDRSFNPALYLVSPFYGINAYAMVFGNIALVVAACGLHLMIITLKWNNKRSLRTTTFSVLSHFAEVRFPNVSIQVAVYAVQEWRWVAGAFCGMLWWSALIRLILHNPIIIIGH